MSPFLQISVEVGMPSYWPASEGNEKNDAPAVQPSDQDVKMLKAHGADERQAGALKEGCSS
jgi:hypothetical protein